jgi:MFS family permease
VSGNRATRGLLTLAAVAVAFAAADTYVVVLALPDMLGSVGYSSEELQRAAPIISGFLLGYVAMLPLIGRIADLRGRVPVLVAAMVVFALGSLVTALSYDMPSMVAGRFLQGLGGGGLVPATLALVADLYPAERRAVPLGIVSAVQEAGSVIGPLFGAVVLAVADWRAIFLINLAVGLVLAAGLKVLPSVVGQDALPAVRGGAPPAVEEGADPVVEEGALARVSKPPPDFAGAFLLLITLAAGALVFVRPSQLLRDLTWGQLFIPFAGDGRWLTPIGAVAMAAALLFLVRCATARRPLVDLPGWWRSMREADLLGAVYLAVALGGVILAFATADPAVELFADQGWWYLGASAVSAVAFVVHIRSAERPLVPRGALRATPAWGAVLVSFFVGAALIAAVVDIPVFARTTIYRDSQLDAALVLVRFLIALPVGAVIGGYLTRRFGAGPVAAVGMLMSAGGFLWMTSWEMETLHHFDANIPLVLCGFGFGLALPPINAAILASTADDVHGLASAFVVVGRMVGMLVGISALTAIGLRRFYAAQEDNPLPPAREVCEGRSRCKAFSDLIAGQGIPQEHTVFAGAAVCAIVAAVLAVVVFRGVVTHGVSAADLLRVAG